MSCGPTLSVEWEGPGHILCFILLPVRLLLNKVWGSGCFRARPGVPGEQQPLLPSLVSPPPLMTSSAPWPPVCSLTDPVISREHTQEVRREGPIPILIYAGWSIKSHPSPPWRLRALRAVQAARKASADRTGAQTSRGALGSRHSLEGQVALHA